MVIAIRGTRSTTVPLGETQALVGADVRDLADAIIQVGLLRPLVVDRDGVILDGEKRARALRLLGESEAPAIRIDLSPIDVTQAAAIRVCNKSRGLATPAFVGASRATLDRFEKVVAAAEDSSLPLSVRLAAAEGITQIAAGASANGVLTSITAARDVERASAKYPELAHLPATDANRMADYLDQITDPDERDLELGVLRLTAGDPNDQSRSLSMSVYTQMQELARNVDQDRANEVAEALAAAITGKALTPALRGRCLEVAAQLEHAARGIRAAMTVEMENA